MSLPTAPTRRLLPRVLTLCALATIGCAGLRGPRIDPTGERILIWPKDQVQAAPAAVANPVAPPVYTDPFFPANQNPAAAAPVVAGPPPHVLKITPDRILAPVGSEVVLKAGICDDKGYLVANQKIEWMLGRNGVGEFVELGGKGHFHSALLPWNKGRKVDNYQAIGYTATAPLCITRGTSDRSDDVEIRRGDAWASITSPVEGTSSVTAHAPSIVSWKERRSQATIHWVDVQWTFPPAHVSSGGRPQTITTTVTRQSDGTPVDGYLVRYTVADGGGAIAGSSASQTVDVRTGVDGRASVEVSPTDSGAGSSNIDVQLIRPARFAGSRAPELAISRSATTISWTGGAPYLEGGASPPISTSPPPIRPTPAPPITTTPAGRPPQLSVELRQVSQGPVEEDGTVRFQVRVRNDGGADATDTALNVRFDGGLSHLRDPGRDLEIENPSLGRISPGQTWEGFLTFDVGSAGPQCIVATVTSREATSAPQQLCVEAVLPATPAVARVAIKKSGPTQGTRGKTELFVVRVENIGEVALTNLVIEDEYPTAFLRPESTSGDAAGEVVQNRVIWRLPRLAPGEVQEFEVNAVCVQATQILPTMTTATVSATNESTGEIMRSSSEHGLEILPPRDQDAPAPAAGAAAGPLRVRVQVIGAGGPIRKETRPRFQIMLANQGDQVDNGVQLRVVFPPELTPDRNAIQGPPGVTFELDGGELVFSELRNLRISEDVTYWIDATAVTAGIGQVVVQAQSSNQPTAVTSAVDIEVIDN
ncbi:hypothetical protein OAS39_11685 [Pirellulales bacterium]|nr:hypothetical protein [Pirellulales bacterium]